LIDGTLSSETQKNSYFSVVLRFSKLM